jgi:glycosyltransferase involved in cell wall biosynthesis
MSDTRRSEPPRFTVCVPTRNSGAGIVPTLESLRSQDHDSFEVIVLDQSTDDATQRAFVDAVGDDRRFSHVPSGTVGKSTACNLILARAQGASLAFTDDDCVVPPDWISGMERAFGQHPGVAMVCGGIRAAPHDYSREFTVEFTPARARLHQSRWLGFRSVGIGGGNLALRTQALREIGGFDEVLGVGAPLRAFEEMDLVFRLLRRGHGVLELPEPAVVHCERKRWETDGRRLVADFAFGEGALLAKHLRLGDPAVLPLALLPLRWVRWGNVVRLRRPNGLLAFTAFLRGGVASFGYPVDRRTRKFRPRRQKPAHVVAPGQPV